MRKQFIVLAAFLVGIVNVNAQQLPLISSYLNTSYLFNPAFSGIEGKTEISVLNRRQWTNIQGAPETQFMAFNGNRDDLKFGYSGYAFNDATDIVSRSGFYGSYAWHVKFTDENSLSLGLGAGYVNNSINSSGIRVPDELDPVLYSQLSSAKFDLNFGFNLQFGDFNIGAAVPNLLAPKVDFGDNFNSPYQYHYMRHYVVNTQYNVQMQKGLMTLSPFVTVRANEVTIPQVDAGLMFNHKEYFYVGAAYRSSYAVTSNAGVHVTENIKLFKSINLNGLLNDFEAIPTSGFVSLVRMVNSAIWPSTIDIFGKPNNLLGVVLNLSCKISVSNLKSANNALTAPSNPAIPNAALSNSHCFCSISFGR